MNTLYSNGIGINVAVAASFAKIDYTVQPDGVELEIGEDLSILLSEEALDRLIARASNAREELKQNGEPVAAN
ncbi:hypothetical protein V5P93_007257 [Actinokineospora auranticolor]|uniref:Uncharacterized protein n=1 Tax=Actinokineospora auranticolor TaxID=155976 RepID=A0A2S6GRP8_9PSEU|nr:hypothetical protein [Actinokineospora auranticolor]PPK67912.1 hypothetical protein CLV40_106143 [Actinokineospora auranticolor]